MMWARLDKSHNLKMHSVFLSAKDCSWLWSHICLTEPFLNAHESHSCCFQYYWFKREIPLVLNSVQDYTALERWPFYSSPQVTWSACKTCWALLSGLLSGREIIAAERKRCRLGNYFKRDFFQSFLVAADILFIIHLEKVVHQKFLTSCINWEERFCWRNTFNFVNVKTLHNIFA